MRNNPRFNPKARWCGIWGSENPELEKTIRELITAKSERIRKAVEAMLEDIDGKARSIARENNTTALSFRNEKLKKLLELLEAFEDQFQTDLNQP